MSHNCHTPCDRGTVLLYLSLMFQRFRKDNCYDNVVYISFYNNRRIADIFDPDYSVHRILTALEIELHVTIDPANTRLIFDDIQGAVKVLESLKYFCENMPELNVCAAGSLLGAALHEGVSFPVGKVDEFHMYPMSFQEFLFALGEQKLADFLEDYHNEGINLFRSFGCAQ